MEGDIMIIAINYANERYTEAQKYNTKTAKDFGCADKVIEYSPYDIDKEFINKNIKILSGKRGGGYWLWKPYIILKTLYEANDGDYIYYCDSGACYANKIQLFVDELEKHDQEIMLLKSGFLEVQYSKRDALILMDCDSEEYLFTDQMTGGFLLIRNSSNSRELLEEWLSYARDERIITDNPNTLGKDNYSEFIENRHDQTVLSLLCKKRGIKPISLPKSGLNEEYNFPKVILSKSEIGKKTKNVIVANIPSFSILARRGEFIYPLLITRHNIRYLYLRLCRLLIRYKWFRAMGKLKKSIFNKQNQRSYM